MIAQRDAGQDVLSVVLGQSTSENSKMQCICKHIVDLGVSVVSPLSMGPFFAQVAIVHVLRIRTTTPDWPTLCSLVRFVTVGPFPPKVSKRSWKTIDMRHLAAHLPRDAITFCSKGRDSDDGGFFD